VSVLNVVRHSASVSLENAPISQGDTLHLATLEPDIAYTAEVSEAPANARGRCVYEDTSRDHPASLAAFQNDVANETATAFIASPAPAQLDTPTITVAITEAEDALVEKKMAIEYPPTPAMSVSELQSTSEDVHSKPSSTAEIDAIETFDSYFEARVTDAPSLARATSHYYSPTVTDQPGSEDKAQFVPTPPVSLVPTVRADDGQIILRPPQDFYRTYLVGKVVNISSLLGFNSQASEKTQTAIASLPRTLNSKTAPSSLSVWLDTLPVSPGTESQENDLTSIMSAPASYPLSAQLLAYDLKRIFITSDVALEEPARKRQKISGDEAVVEEVEEVLKNPTSFGDGGLLALGTAADTKPDMSDSYARSISPTQEHTSDTVNSDVSNTPVDLVVEEFRPPPWGDHGGAVSLATPAERLTGVYVQSPNMEIEERCTTVSRSPTFVSSILLSNLSRSTLKSLKSPVDPTAPIKSKVNKQEEHDENSLAEHLSDAEEEKQKAGSDTQESDELSEADEEEISRLANELETCLHEEVPDMTRPLKESTPAPPAEAVEESDSGESTTGDAIAHQFVNAAHTAKLRHEAEFHYERRATRSEIRTSDHGPGATSSVEEETDALSAPVVKEEDPEFEEPTSKLRSRQTVDTTVKPAAPKPKASVAATRAKPTPKALGASKSTSRSASKPVSKAKPPPKQGKATTIKPKPKAKTPVSPQTFSTTVKSRKGADAKTTAICTKGVSGKCKTRRSSALEEEIAKTAEAENSIAKRLRSKDAE
jgi:hypothetical protein